MSQKRPSEPVELPPVLAPSLGRPIPGGPQRPVQAVPEGERKIIRMGYDTYGRSVAHEEIDRGDPTPMPTPVLEYLQSTGAASISLFHNHRRYLVQVGRSNDPFQLRTFVYELPSMRRILAREQPRTHELLVARAEAQLIELAERCSERSNKRKVH